LDQTHTTGGHEPFVQVVRESVNDS